MPSSFIHIIKNGRVSSILYWSPPFLKPIRAQPPLVWLWVLAWTIPLCCKPSATTDSMQEGPVVEMWLCITVSQKHRQWARQMLRTVAPRFRIRWGWPGGSQGAVGPRNSSGKRGAEPGFPASPGASLCLGPPLGWARPGWLQTCYKARVSSRERKWNIKQRRKEAVPKVSLQTEL